MPDKRFWYLKIKALAASGQWEALRAFANEKKSPVGYKPFAQACIEHGQPPGAVEAYIDRIPQMEDKCVGCGIRMMRMGGGGVEGWLTG